MNANANTYDIWNPDGTHFYSTNNTHSFGFDKNLRHLMIKPHENICKYSFTFHSNSQDQKFIISVNQKYDLVSSRPWERAIV